MANRTVKDAHTVKGTNPQYLVEKIIRTRIYDCKYWKEECFGLSADLIVDKGTELRYIGGIYAGNIKPTPFLCLVLKLLQIQPEKDIIIEFIRQEDFKYMTLLLNVTDCKYLRALGCFYMRLTGNSIEIFKYLEPLYNDYRKLRSMNKDGEFEIIHMDEFIDKLLREDRVCDIQLPRLQKREVLETSNQLEPRISVLEEDLENLESSSDEEADSKLKSGRDRRSPGRRRSRSRSPPRRHRSNSRDRDHRHRRSRSRDRRPERTSHRDKDRSGRGGGDRDRGGPESRKDPKVSDRKRGTREDSYDRDIREANELRAKLGMKPLEQ